MNWLLPEYIADALPAEAERIERLRRARAEAGVDGVGDRAGERVSYVLMVNVDDVTQYVSNTDRKDGIELIESLLARWKVGRADIPAHYNPDLPANPAAAPQGGDTGAPS